MGRTAAADAALDAKLAAAGQSLAGCGRVVIAFSGGVDSSLLAALAVRALGRDNVLAVTADSPSLAREDLAESARVAGALGARHEVVATHEVDDPRYQANTAARCFVCKQELFDALEPIARRERAVIVYGAIGDDDPAERPGQQAAQARGVRAPLQDAGLTKAEVRTAARLMGLPNWDRPQNACLSSRIPHGEPVTEAKLRQVEEAEACLRNHGFRQVRVRHLGERARIEVGSDEVHRFLDGRLSAEVLRRFEALGFSMVSVDRAGYRAGGADHPADEVPLRAVCRC
jgi:uncharacterized protein